MTAHLPLRDYEKGMTLSEENAKRLIDDAKILFREKRYPSALYLAVQGIEEIGKALLFLRSRRQKKGITKCQWKKEFCDHPRKLEEVEKAIARHVRKIESWEGFGPDLEAMRKIPEDEFQKDFVKWLKQDKDRLAYVDYDFTRIEFSSPCDPDVIGGSRDFVESVVYRYSEDAMLALEKEKSQHTEA